MQDRKNINKKENTDIANKNTQIRNEQKDRQEGHT